MDEMEGARGATPPRAALDEALLQLPGAHPRRAAEGRPPLATRGHEHPGLAASADAERRLQVVIAGHVDHGKSTILGRLLADSGALPEGKLDQIRALCARTERPFEYAFLLDALRDEQAQGITIDAARVFFRTARRGYLLIDAPGHVEFLRNMVTGASRAEAALLVIDAAEGARENSYRHGYLLAMLGIRQVAVIINKMDLAGHDQGAYERVVQGYGAFLQRAGVTPACFVPASGRLGGNIAYRSPAMPWYRGPTVLEALEGFQAEAPPVDRPLRVLVQDVYKFTARGDDRRIVAGTVESGVLRVDDEVVFLPSGKRSRVRTIEAFNRPRQESAAAGAAVGFTLQEQVYVARGEIATLAAQPRPQVTSHLRASVFWLGQRPLRKDREYLLRLGTARVPARVEDIHRVIDAAELRHSEGRDRVERNEVAECTFSLRRAIAFDLADEGAATSRFVLVDDYEIRGGGIVRAALPDGHQGLRERVLRRNNKWEPSCVSLEQRAERYSQRPVLVLLTGEKGAADRKRLAKELEARLFSDGRVVYYLGMGSVVYGLDADITPERPGAGAPRDAAPALAQGGQRQEHLRRLGEVANLLLDAGVILIATAAELTGEDLDLIRAVVDPGQVETVWVGGGARPDAPYELVLPEPGADGVHILKGLLQERGVLFRPF